jgi:hypothetical protein
MARSDFSFVAMVEAANARINLSPPALKRCGATVTARNHETGATVTARNHETGAILR